jgi:hypothetical protein
MEFMSVPAQESLEELLTLELVVWDSLVPDSLPPAQQSQEELLAPELIPPESEELLVSDSLPSNSVMSLPSGSETSSLPSGSETTPCVFAAVTFMKIVSHGIVLTHDFSSTWITGCVL